MREPRAGQSKIEWAADVVPDGESCQGCEFHKEKKCGLFDVESNGYKVFECCDKNGAIEKMKSWRKKIYGET